MASSVDILTLDNFESKMPKWDLENSNPLYALVDMGSNGIRFSISDLSTPQARLLPCVYRERAAISLFDALNDNSAGSSDSLTFPEATIAEVSQTLARFRSIAVKDYGVPLSQISVFATEAMRRAANAGAMLDAIGEAAPGLTVQILAPEVETLFGAMGARSAFSRVRGLFLDLGGGSVQMTWMDAASNMDPSYNLHPSYEIAAAKAGESLPFGAARLIRVLETASADVRAAEEEKLASGLARAFSTLKEKFPTIGLAINRGDFDVYLCGGGFRGYGSMLMHNDPIQPYPIPHIGAYRVSGDFFRDTATMRRVNEEYEGKIFGMSKRRRRQFPAIATVIEALVKAVPDINSVTFCAGGNREGALMMTLPFNIRELEPLTLLTPADKMFTNHDTIRTVTESLMTSVGWISNFSEIPSVLRAPLTMLFAAQIWDRLGHDGDANAAHALHHATHGYASLPGLTHLEMAVLGLTLCERWGAGIGPIDLQLYRNLRALVDAAHPEASFWTEYLGAVAAALGRVVPAWPAGQTSIDTIKFRRKINGNKIELRIFVDPEATRGIDYDDLAGLFKNVGKGKIDKKKSDKKVVATVQKMEELSEYDSSQRFRPNRHEEL